MDEMNVNGLDLASLTAEVGGEPEETAALAAVVEEEEYAPQTTLNQSGEFLRKFADSFSKEFVLQPPDNYPFKDTKVEQDKKLALMKGTKA